MQVKAPFLIFAGFASGVGIVLAVPYLLKKCTSSKSKERIRVLFFPDQSLACLKKFSVFSSCSNANCSFTHNRASFAEVIEFLSSPARSLDIAIYVFTSPILGQLVEELFTIRKIAVRIIVDRESAHLVESMIPKLQSLGIPVRTNEGSSYFVHDKFAIVDGKSVMTGSFNWTQKAVTRNSENLLIIEGNPDVGKQYSDEFQKIWTQLDSL